MRADAHGAADEAAGRLLTAHVDAVLRRIPASRRVRAALRAELDDGLDCAMRARIERGMPPDAAAADAVRDFGDPAVVAATFRDELLAAGAHRAGLGLLGTGPLVGLAWVVTAPVPPGTAWPDRVLAAVTAGGCFPLALAVAIPAALFAVAAGGRLGHRLGPRFDGDRWAAGAALLAVSACGTGDLGLLATSVAGGIGGDLGVGLTLLPVAASGARLILVTSAAWRLLRLRVAQH
jgi:hypothetical protein